MSSPTETQIRYHQAVNAIVKEAIKNPREVPRLLKKINLTPPEKGAIERGIQRGLELTSPIADLVNKLEPEDRTIVFGVASAHARALQQGEMTQDMLPRALIDLALRDGDQAKKLMGQGNQLSKFVMTATMEGYDVLSYFDAPRANGKR